MVPDGVTRSSSASMTRIGPRAFVTITRTNSSVEVAPTVVAGWLATPALTNSRSNVPGARRSCNAAICVGTVTSTVSISIILR